MLPHLAGQLRDSIPVVLAARVVELLDVARSFGCVRLRKGRTMSATARRQHRGNNTSLESRSVEVRGSGFEVHGAAVKALY
jgi:hypothetical protein